MECPAPITSEQSDLSGDVATTITNMCKSAPISDLIGYNNLDTDTDPTNAQQPTGTSQMILIRGAEQFDVYAAESTCSNKCGEVKSCV